ncbi:hypothetical protein PBOI14_08440 [Pseudomonas sp. Boi14]|nr:hypothetical protein PBOI14_08440 [Pseudomonas sp. Boi14]
MRWLRIALGFTVTLLTLLCLNPALAAQGSGWAVLLDEQADLQLSDIRSPRYTNQFSPIELDKLTAAEPDGALWLRFKLQPGTHEQILRIFAPDLSHLNLYVLEGDKLIEQVNTGSGTSQAQKPCPAATSCCRCRKAPSHWTSMYAWCPNTSCAPSSPCNRR